MTTYGVVSSIQSFSGGTVFELGQLSPVPGTGYGHNRLPIAPSSHIFQQDAGACHLVTNGHDPETGPGEGLFFGFSPPPGFREA